MKQCKQCKETKELTEFCADRWRKDGLSNRCKSCDNAKSRSYHAANRVEHNRVKMANHFEKPATNRNSQLKRKYGITLNDYNGMFDAQGGVCAICLKPETSKDDTGKLKNLSTDHNHTTGEVRSLLCHRCNAGLGLFFENPTNLRRAAEYAEKHNQFTNN